MTEALKPSVLVTGGAGYIGSHAVLALKDPGWPVAVIDNLSTGFAFAVPEDVPLYEGDISDTILLEQIFAEQGIEAIMHFAGSIIVPERDVARLPERTESADLGSILGRGRCL